jgi:LCP family protein required for cell wall assembly
LKTLRLNTSPRVFWSTAVAIALGIIAGIGILTFTHKNPARALTQITNFGLRADNSTLTKIPILPKLNEQMTLLIMGVDSNGKNTDRFANTRSDTMILVSLDPINQKVGVVSIPRDSRVKIANSQRYDKINAAHAYGGPELAVKTISETFGINIDRFAVVDTYGLKQLCRLIGPMEVLVEKEMHYHDHTAKLSVDLKPGLQILNAEQLEEYIRFRHDAKGDIGRIERQQWFLRQALHKLADPQIVFMLPDLIKLGQDYVQTNLSYEDMARIASFVKDVPRDHILTCTLPGTPEMISGGSYWVPDFEATKAIFARIVPYASMPNNFDSYNNIANDSNNKPVSIAIKYAKGSEIQANQLEVALTNLGYKVKYKWQTAKEECQHEEIVLNSTKIDEQKTNELKNNLPDISKWPIILEISTSPVVDMTLIITPTTSLPAVANKAGISHT